MPKKKPLTVIIPDEALRNLPESEREAIKEHLREMFAEGVPAESTPLEEVGVDAVCPHCTGRLDFITTLAVPNGPMKDLVSCNPCDMEFVRPSVS